MQRVIFADDSNSLQNIPSFSKIRVEIFGRMR
jgi:hypothetical protein